MTSFNGTQTTWDRFEADLPELNGQNDVQIRFYLETDISQTRDGFYVDDIDIMGTDVNCAPVSWGELLTQWPSPTTVLDLANWLNAAAGR